MLSLVSTSTVHIAIDAHVADDEIHGQIRSDDGPTGSFSGWLGLISALDKFLTQGMGAEARGASARDADAPSTNGERHAAHVNNENRGGESRCTVMTGEQEQAIPPQSAGGCCCSPGPALSCFCARPASSCRRPMAAASWASDGLALAMFGQLCGHAGELPGLQTFASSDPARKLTLVDWTNLKASSRGLPCATTIAERVIGRFDA